MDKITLCKSFPAERLEHIVREIGGGREAFLHVASFETSRVLPHLIKVRRLRTDNPMLTGIIYTTGLDEKILRTDIHAKIVQADDELKNKEVFVSSQGLIMLYSNGENFVSYDSAVVKDICEIYRKNLGRLLTGQKPFFISSPWDVEYQLSNIVLQVNEELVKQEHGDKKFLAMKAGEILGSDNDSTALIEKFADIPNVFVFGSPYK